MKMDKISAFSNVGQLGIGVDEHYFLKLHIAIQRYNVITTIHLSIFYYQLLKSNELLFSQFSRGSMDTVPDLIDSLLVVPDLRKRMLLKWSISMVFTCPLLS